MFPVLVFFLDCDTTLTLLPSIHLSSRLLSFYFILSSPLSSVPFFFFFFIVSPLSKRVSLNASLEFNYYFISFSINRSSPHCFYLSLIHPLCASYRSVFFSFTCLGPLSCLQFLPSPLSKIFLYLPFFTNNFFTFTSSSTYQSRIQSPLTFLTQVSFSLLFLPIILSLSRSSNFVSSAFPFSRPLFKYFHHEPLLFLPPALFHRQTFPIFTFPLRFSSFPLRHLHLSASQPIFLSLPPWCSP